MRNAVVPCLLGGGRSNDRVNAMLKRLSSLALVLLITGNVFAGAARVRDEHVCEMAGMEMMPCCHEGQAQAPKLDHDYMSVCCVAIPQAPGSSGTTFKLSPPSFSIAVLYPQLEHSPSILSRGEHPSAQFFLPNLQTTYIRNLSLLI